MACKPKSKDAAIRAGKLMEVYNKWAKNDIKIGTQVKPIGHLFKKFD